MVKAKKPEPAGPQFPIKVSWFELGYNFRNREHKTWYEGIAVAETEKTYLVWRPMGSYDGHPRLLEILKERTKVRK